MKVKPPFVGFPSPGLAVVHLFSRVVEKFQHIAYLAYDEAGPMRAHAVRFGEARYRGQDLQRWSEFDQRQSSEEL